MSRFFAVALAAVFFVLTAILPAATQGPTMGMAPNNNSLQALYPGQYASVIRMGFAAQGDAPLLSYTWVATNCDLPDNGAEVQPATGTGCWHAMFQGVPDARQWGLALTSTPAGNLAALNAAIHYAGTFNGCIGVPQPATPYQVGSTLTLLGANGIGGCLKGVRAPGYSGVPNAGCQLQFTDTTGIAINEAGARLEDLSWCGNAATSTKTTATAGLSITTAREVTLRNLYIQNFVDCRLITGAYSRSHEDNIHCADQNLYPNLTNGFPRTCVRSVQGTSGSWAAMRVENDECRQQSWAGPNIDIPGDGVTTAFDVPIPPGGIPLWAADGIKPKVGNRTVLPNGYILKDAPRKICGVDYTLWDISSAGGGGSGGLKVYCARKTLQTTTGNAVATVTAGGTGDIPAVLNPSNLEVVSDHGLDLYPRITAVNTGANQITMSGPATVSETMTVELVQLDIAHDGCGATTCGINMEVRFAVPPASGINVNPQWDDPTGQVVYDVESGSDFLVIEPIHLGGYRMALRWIGQAYGGLRLRNAYFENINQIADIEASSYGITLEFNDVINWHANGAYAGSYGGNVAPWYVSPIAGPATIHWNNRDWLYNGARVGNNRAAYGASGWYQGLPLGTSFAVAGVALSAVDQAECEPLLFDDSFRLWKFGIDVTNAGAGASLKFYLYERDPQTGRPGRQLSASTAPVAITTTGGWPAPMSDYIGSPGLYWGCYVGTWTTAPSLVAVQAISSSNVPGPGARVLGASSVGALYGATAPQAAVYASAGLYASGLPPVLSGLTHDQTSLQPGALSWQPTGQQP